ncbi:hypothetical protein G6O69_15760 [Pseudenhygromyxa sp. WMMC2535]|nr:hypothetical protein [Pseudenhygromyxa sp. WMMC2535]
MCDDCQTYMRWLDRQAFLDASGGTEVVQLYPDQVTLDEGREHLRCARLSPKGLMRWYAGCCKTPVVNGLDKPRVPFLGVHGAFIALEGDAREDALGPIRARVMGRFGQRPLPPGSYERAPFGLLVRVAGQLARGYFGGRHQPSPVYDARGESLVAPAVLDRAERDAARP